MDATQKLFVSLISSFHIEDIRDAILHDLDLAETLQKEAPDYIAGFKAFAIPYHTAHGKEIEEALRNSDASAKQLVDWLKTQRPDLAYEIEMYQKYPTVMTLGLQIVKKNSEIGADSGAVPNQSDAKHVGYSWVSKNITSLGRLLLE